MNSPGKQRTNTRSPVAQVSTFVQAHIQDTSDLSSLSDVDELSSHDDNHRDSESNRASNSEQSDFAILPEPPTPHSTVRGPHKASRKTPRERQSTPHLPAEPFIPERTIHDDLFSRMFINKHIGGGSQSTNIQ
jgi:hypothetical protein